MSEVKVKIQDSILKFNQGNLSENALTLFQTLGYATDRQSPFAEKTFKSFKEAYLDGQSFREEKALVPDWKYADLLFQLSGSEIEFGAAARGALIKKEVKTTGTVMESYLFFAVELSNAHYSRTELSQITREINKVFPMPVMILFKHGKTLSISIINRKLHKRDERRDVLKKVTLIKDIDIEKPHRAHIEILFDLSFQELLRVHKFTNFVELHNAWQKTLDTKELNKKFYSELFNWYLWAKKNVKFPQIRPAEDLIKDNIHQSESLIRLLTRLLFCWFMKEKGLINEELFNTENLNEILKGFKGQDSNETIYYKAILQNLFFATLNKPIADRKLIKNVFPNPAYGDPLVYRYTELFKNEADILRHFENIPFLNGGLFDCLDSRKDENNPVEIRLDGFSTKKSKQPIVPDKLFFGEYPGIDLSGEHEYDDSKKSKVTVYGLINILTHYKFTIEENTPIEEEIALDPELLGKVFENLLASYNPETQTAARNLTGSFYTPREIVNYMVDESLKAYLKQKLTENKAMKPEDADVALGFLFEYSEKEHLFDEKQVAVLLAAIDSCKVLDPACGSGAFPMGVLQKLIHILRKVDQDNKRWFEIVISKFPASAQNVMRAKLEHENWDYVRKLGIVQECIYGVDIQPIAIQISKLRFFITLLVDQNEKPGAINRGFEALPNLDFKLVAANTLIGVPETDIVTTGLFAAQTDPFFDEFDKLTEQYFSAYAPKDKIKLKEKIMALITEKCDEKVKAIKNLSSHHDERFSKVLAEKHKNPIEEKEREVKLWNSYKNLFKQEAAGFFEPKYFFPKTAGGFDVVIGNPPYVDIKGLPKEEVKLYFKTFSTTENRINLYAIFIEKGFSLLNQNGKLVFINPNSILINESYKKIRKHIIDGVEKIIKLPDSVFEASVVETIILLISKKSKNENIEGIYFSKNDLIDFNHLNFNLFKRTEWRNDPESRFNIFSSDKIIRLLKSLERSCEPLEKFIFTSLGITPYDKYKGHSEKLITNREFHSTKKLSKQYVPLISGKNIHHFYITDCIEEYLKYGEWLGAPREKKFFETSKIIVRQIVSGNDLKIVAGYSEKPYYFTQIGFSLISKTEDKKRLKFILCLLNSSLLSFYHRNKFLDIEKVVFQKILIINCKLLPIKTTEYQNLFSIVADYLIFFADSNISKTPFFERLVNAMVYELYLPDEIKSAGCEVLKHLANLPELKDEWDNEKKLAVIEKVYKELSSPAHPVSIAMSKMQEVPEIKIIEGRNKGYADKPAIISRERCV